MFWEFNTLVGKNRLKKKMESQKHREKQNTEAEKQRNRKTKEQSRKNTKEQNLFSSSDPQPNTLF